MSKYIYILEVLNSGQDIFYMLAKMSTPSVLVVVIHLLVSDLPGLLNIAYTVSIPANNTNEFSYT